MLYREYPPIALLAPAVACVWTLEGDAAEPGSAQPVLPDGRAELVLHVGDPFSVESPSRGPVSQSRVIFAGQLDSQLLLRPSGRVAVVGVRFHPHGAAALIREPQHRLAGEPLGDDALPPALARELAAVRDVSGDLRAAAAAVQRALARWVECTRIDPRIAHAARLVARSGGRLSIDRLAIEAGLSCRQLERRFLDQVGVTPKRLARLTRFQRALGLLDSTGATRRVADTAAACGYADQAHFVRDFQRLAGCAPSRYLLRRAELTGFFVSGTLQ